MVAYILLSSLYRTNQGRPVAGGRSRHREIWNDRGIVIINHRHAAADLLITATTCHNIVNEANFEP